MSDFLAIISNVKIIKCVQGNSPELARSAAYDKLADAFPPVDVIIRNGVAHIFADVPGMSPEDISVYVYDCFVVIEGLKRGRNIYRGYELIRLERHFPSFKRVFRLPFDAYRYEALLDGGVLHIALAEN